MGWGESWGPLGGLVDSAISSIQTEVEGVIQTGGSAIKAQLPVWTEDLFGYQSGDTLANPTQGPGAFGENINQQPVSATIQSPLGGLFGSATLDTTDVAILGVIGVGGVLLALRLARVI